MQGLREHAEEHDLLAGEDADEVEHAVDDVALEDVAGHVLGGRHVLERVAGEQLPDELRVGDLVDDLVGRRGVDLERVAEADLPRLEVGAQGEGLVDEVRADDRVALLEGVGGREVVVLAGVDDDAGARVDQARRYWSTNVRCMLMSRKRMPYMASFSIMSSRSSAPIVAISGMQRPLA